MTRILLCTAAALGLSAGGALAQSAVEQVTAQLAAEGYTDIEVERDGSRIEVEAIKDGVRYEYAYDRISGRILEQEVRPVDEDSDDGSNDSNDLGGRPVDGDDSDEDDDENRGHGNDDDGFDEGNPGGSSDDDDDDEDENEVRGGRDDGDDDSGDDEGDDD